MPFRTKSLNPVHWTFEFSIGFVPMCIYMCVCHAQCTLNCQMWVMSFDFEGISHLLPIFILTISVIYSRQFHNEHSPEHTCNYTWHVRISHSATSKQQATASKMRDRAEGGECEMAGEGKIVIYLGYDPKFEFVDYWIIPTISNANRTKMQRNIDQLLAIKMLKIINWKLN